MSTNFDFLKKIDKNLFEIISEAEKLYRDEYFEQCMTQTRKFGENVCKKVLGKNITFEKTEPSGCERDTQSSTKNGKGGIKTFDDMLATLNDCSTGTENEKEFINDLYFLKKHGNSAVHSSSVKKDGMTALECLKRAFEIAISYSVFHRRASSDILRLHYDTELLVTGKTGGETLAEKYTEKKAKNALSSKQKNPAKLRKTTSKKTKKQSSVMVCKQQKTGISLYWILTGLSFAVSAIIMLVLIISIYWK